MDTSRYIVSPLPCGATFHGCTVVSDDRREAVIFVKTADGQVYHTQKGRYELNLLGDYVMNDRDRRAWALLAGVPFKELYDARKLAKAEADTRERARMLANVQHTAKKLGYALVSIDQQGPQQGGV
jgi:hypothetical protein